MTNPDKIKIENKAVIKTASFMAKTMGKKDKNLQF